MDDMIESRLEVCADHPKQQNIFFLEKMLLEAGFPYYFNFWDDLRPTPYNQEGGDPEKDIDWDNYHFIIELEHGAGMPFPLMSIERFRRKSYFNGRERGSSRNDTSREPERCSNFLRRADAGAGNGNHRKFF